MGVNPASLLTNSVSAPPIDAGSATSIRPRAALSSASRREWVKSFKNPKGEAIQKGSGSPAARRAAVASCRRAAGLVSRSRAARKRAAAALACTTHACSALRQLSFL